MIINLFDAASNLKTTKFTFVSSQKVVTDAQEATKTTEARPSSFYLMLELEQPIPIVFGFNSMWDEGKRIPFSAVDVTHIRVYAEFISKYSSEFTNIALVSDTSFSGIYEGNMFFEVSRAEEVWLTDKKFATFSAETKQAKELTKLNALRTRFTNKPI